MEYPTPRVKVTGGRLDLSDAFQRAIGPYDEMMAKYAYTVPGRPGEGRPGGRDPGDATRGLHYVPETDPRWTCTTTAPRLRNT